MDTICVPRIFTGTLARYCTNVVASSIPCGMPYWLRGGMMASREFISHPPKKGSSPINVRCRFLASADLLGTTFSAPALATGFGAHLAVPLLRRVCPDEAAVENITREQAVAAVEECMKVLFYRDARSLNKYSLAVITGEDVEGEAKVNIEWERDIGLQNQSWRFAEGIRGYGAQVV